MPDILKKLRLKFMLMTLGIVASLIAIISIAYCISVYSSASNEIEMAFGGAVNASMGESHSQKPPQNTQDFNSDPEGDNPKASPDNQFSFDAGNDESPNLDELDADQRIDLFHGQSTLVYSVAIDYEGTVLRNDSPAIQLDEEVLEVAIANILASPDFSNEDGQRFSGRIDSENLFYQANSEGGIVYLGLADSSAFDERIQGAIFGSLGLAGLALLLTVIVSFFLARLFLRPVEEAWDKQRRFIADASHELKTPLTVIMANTEIVRSEPTSTVAHQMKWLDGTMDESDRMHGLIADLLLLARMDDEQIEAHHPNKESVDFSEAVLSTLVSFEAIAYERKLTIEEDIDGDIFIEGAHSRLSRLPDILVDNACKYAEAEGRIEVSLKSSGSKVVLRVFNTGPTIAKTDMAHLFDRFYRADESRCDDIPGYGLGLSIAQNIAGESKGVIEVSNISPEDKEGSLGAQGVAFTVTFEKAG